MQDDEPDFVVFPPEGVGTFSDFPLVFSLGFWISFGGFQIILFGSIGSKSTTTSQLVDGFSLARWNEGFDPVEKKIRIERQDGDDFMRLKFAPRFPVIAELSDYVPSCKLR